MFSDSLIGVNTKFLYCFLVYINKHVKCELFTFYVIEYKGSFDNHDTNIFFNFIYLIDV